MVKKPDFIQMEVSPVFYAMILSDAGAVLLRHL